MRKRWHILLLTLFLAFFVTQVNEHVLHLVVSEEDIREEQGSLERSAPPAGSPLAPDLEADYSHIPATEQQTLYDRLSSMIDAESLQKYEGSHTWDDLRAGSDEPTLYNLSSGWIWGGSNTPQAGITVWENPETGEYEVSGGEIFLPKRGVGISYEEDKQTDETRTFFNLKKEF